MSHPRAFIGRTVESIGGIVSAFFEHEDLDELWVERQKCDSSERATTNSVDMMSHSSVATPAISWLNERQAKVARVGPDLYLDRLNR